MTLVADGQSRLFVNVGGLGFDAEVARRAARSRLPGSTAPYVSGVAGALLRYHRYHMTIDADGTCFEGRTLALLVANGRAFGGGIAIVPDAVPDDGWLDVAILGNASRLDVLRQVPGVYRGAHVNHPKFTHLPARSISVESDDLAHVELDGEVVGTAPVTFAIEQAALHVIG